MFFHRQKTRWFLAKIRPLKAEKNSGMVTQLGGVGTIKVRIFFGWLGLVPSGKLRVCYDLT
jgi:hypothetical protein